MRAMLLVLLCAGFSGCLAEEGGLTDFAESPGCPLEDFVWTESVVVANMAGGGRTAGGSAQEETLDVREATGWNARQASCVEAIRVDIAWRNTVQSGGDLYVGVVVPGANLPVEGHDEQQYAVDGQHTESVLAPTGLDGFTGESLLEGLRVLLITDWAVASASGLPVDITVTLVV